MDDALHKIERMGGRVQRDVGLVRLVELEKLGGVEIDELFGITPFSMKAKIFAN
jgi:hypothetical protein